jgi:Transglycosylase/Domain of Unknown Function (DUF748)
VTLAVAPLFFVPALVRQRVAHVVRERLGLATTIDGVSPGLRGVDLSGVHLQSDDDPDGVHVNVEHVDVELSWSGALFEGAAAVSGVSASGVEGTVDLSSPAYSALREKLRASRSSSSGPATQRKLEAARFSLVVRDGEQELLSLEGTKAQVTPREISASLTSLTASKPGLASAAMSGVELTLSRTNGLQLQSLQVDDARLAIQSPVHAAATQAARDTDNSDSDPDKVPQAEPPPTAASPAGHDRRESLQALMAKLAPDAELELKRATIEQVTGKQSVPILTDVACQLRVQSDGGLRVTGKGAAQAGGRLDVDMRFWPSDLRADGRVALSGLPLTLLVPILPSVPWFEPEKSRIDAELNITAESPARVSLDGYARLHNVSLFADRLATEPVQIASMNISGSGHWLPPQRRLEITLGSFSLGKAKANIQGAVEIAKDHYAFDLDTSLPATPCTDAVRSIPSALLGDMALAQWRGNIAGRLRFQTDSRELDKTVLNMDVTDHCDFQLVPVMADLSRFSKPFEHVVTEPDGTTFEFETGPGSEAWTPIEAMSPYFVHAVMVHEDPQFFSHHGFSPINIRNALVRDLRERRYAVGASTITMQLIKNIFLHREKTLARKIQEVLLTWWTERVMEKRDILELYLNVIEYGPSVYGIRSAAKHYWNRLPAELSPAESVFLANILPNPKHFHTYYERNALSSSWASSMRSFLKRLYERGVYDKDAYDYGVHELEHFRFSRDGQPAEPRVIPGAASPLPYQPQTTQDTFDANTFVAPGGF